MTRVIVQHTDKKNNLLKSLLKPDKNVTGHKNYANSNKTLGKVINIFFFHNVCQHVSAARSVLNISYTKQVFSMDAMSLCADK